MLVAPDVIAHNEEAHGGALGVLVLYAFQGVIEPPQRGRGRIQHRGFPEGDIPDLALRE